MGSRKKSELEREKERLKVVRVYLATMTHGLNILGINIPEEM